MMAYFKHSRRDGSNTSLDRTGRLTLYHPTKVYSSSRDSMLAESGIWHDRSPRRYGMLGGGSVRYHYCYLHDLLCGFPHSYCLLTSFLIYNGSCLNTIPPSRGRKQFWKKIIRLINSRVLLCSEERPLAILSEVRFAVTSAKDKGSVIGTHTGNMAVYSEERMWPSGSSEIEEVV